MKHPKGAAKVRCGYYWERRTPGRRYVNARGQCTRETWHPSGYCSEHRAPWRTDHNKAPEPPVPIRDEKDAAKTDGSSSASSGPISGVP